MYAIVEIAGFEYKVKPGDRITVPHLGADADTELEFTSVKLLKDDEKLHIAPKAVVKARVLGRRQGKKLIVYKFKRRKGYRRKIGYRDTLTDLEITDIAADK